MKKSLPIKKICILAAIGICTAHAAAYSESLSEKQADIDAQAQQHKQKIEEAEQQLGEVSEKMRLLQDELDAADSAYSTAKTKLDEMNARIEELQAQLQSREADLEKNRLHLQKRVRNIYMHGQLSYISILFGAQDLSDFLRRVELVRRVLRSDYNLIAAVQSDIKAIDETKQELEPKQAELSSLFDDAAAKKAELDDKKAALSEMQDKLRYDKATSEQAYDELMAASAQIEQMIQNRGSSAAAGTGRMIWPLAGPVTSEFGWRTHPIYGTARYHSGLDIGGDYGQSVCAADSGTVSYAGWISGYGNTVIIDHGGGVSTLYGHNQSLAVSVGQSVAQGETIAYCGSTGNSTGPHCHFEVRVNGEPVSPYNYL